MIPRGNRLAIVVTHPIQYFSPVFQILHENDNVLVKVFYTKSVEENTYDVKFQRNVHWDIPLLDGYNYTYQPGGTKRQNRALINALENWSPHAILVYGWSPPGHLSVMRYFKGKRPVWFRGDSNLLDEKFGFRKWIRRCFLTKVYRNIDKAFYVGTQNRSYFLRHGVKESQLVFAPHAIDNDRFIDGPGKEYEDQALKWRRSLNIPDHEFVILFAGKLEHKKAPDLLLEAFLMLTKEEDIKSIHLIFAGSGDLEATLQERSKNYHNVHFIGFQNQGIMPVVYRLGNVFCLPSRGPGETWGLAVNEALACNRKVVVSDKVGCAIDLVADPTSGLVFQVGNVIALANRIKESWYLMMNEVYSSNSVQYWLNENWSFLRQVQVFEQHINKLSGN